MNSNQDQSLPERSVQSLSGEEEFRFQGTSLGFNLLDFWRWSASDVLNKTIRAQIAEYLVARAVNAQQQVLDVGSPFDVLDPQGIRIEVKSAAYLQSWAQKRFSRISFLVPASCLIDVDTFQLSGAKRRQADVYVFAHLKDAVREAGASQRDHHRDGQT